MVVIECGVALNRLFIFKYLEHLIKPDLRDYDDMEWERKALSVRGKMRVHMCALLQPR